MNDVQFGVVLNPDQHRTASIVENARAAEAAGFDYVSRRPLRGPGNLPIRTTPEIWASIVAELVVEERFDTVNFLPQIETVDQILVFGDAVIPLAMQAAADLATSQRAAPAIRSASS